MFRGNFLSLAFFISLSMFTYAGKLYTATCLYIFFNSAIVKIPVILSCSYTPLA